MHSFFLIPSIPSYALHTPQAKICGNGPGLKKQHTTVEPCGVSYDRGFQKYDVKNSPLSNQKKLFYGLWCQLHEWVCYVRFFVETINLGSEAREKEGNCGSVSSWYDPDDIHRYLQDHRAELHELLNLKQQDIVYGPFLGLKCPLLLFL